MAYKPQQKHHRRSIRLPGYDYTSSGAYFITICCHLRQCLLGEIVNGEMQLSNEGRIVRSHWFKLPKYHPRLKLDAFVVMPNHIHGILVLTDIPDINFQSPVGAGLAKDLWLDLHSDTKPAPTTNPNSDTKPAPTNPNFGAKPAPTNHHGIPEIIRGFKTFSARSINKHRKTIGTPVWQRNYYEHIVRNELSLQAIRQYVHNNPQSWQDDQLHSNYPSNQ